MSRLSASASRLCACSRDWTAGPPNADGAPDAGTNLGDLRRPALRLPNAALDVSAELAPLRRQPLVRDNSHRQPFRRSLPQQARTTSRVDSSTLTSMTLRSATHPLHSPDRRQQLEERVRARGRSRRKADGSSRPSSAGRSHPTSERRGRSESSARQRTADRIAAIARPAITANCVAVTWASPSRGSGSTTGCQTLTRAPEHPDLAADSVRCGNRICPQSHRVTQSVDALPKRCEAACLVVPSAAPMAVQESPAARAAATASRSFCSAASRPFLAAMTLRKWLASRRLSGDTASRRGPCRPSCSSTSSFITALQRVVELGASSVRVDEARWFLDRDSDEFERGFPTGRAL
jgi:hypothetical protein